MYRFRGSNFDENANTFDDGSCIYCHAEALINDGLDTIVSCEPVQLINNSAFEIIIGVQIKIDNPKELGTDIVLQLVLSNTITIVVLLSKWRWINCCYQINK